MSEETPEQVTLDDLPSLDHAGVDSSDLFTSCPRCECAVSKSPGAFDGHKRWHAAIEANADPRLSQLRRATLDQFVQGSRALQIPVRPEQVRELVVALGLDQATGFYAALDEVRRLIGKWSEHSCEAHCTRDHPEGDISDQALSDLLLLVGVTVTPEQLANWTPEQREQAVEWAGLVHLDASDNDVDVPERPAFLDGPAEAEQVCPSLFLWDGQLLACRYMVDNHDCNHAAASVEHESVNWLDHEAVPSPWPVDREPPAGITLLEDQDEEIERYVVRVEGAGFNGRDMWKWSAYRDGSGSNDPAAWKDVVMAAEGDLIVVRP
jgi:hypothetical protein